MRKLSISLIILTLAIILAACGGSSGDPARGEEIFTTGGSSSIPCMLCHTLDGSVLVGPSLQGIGTRGGTLIEGTSAEDYIRQSITSPSAYITSGYSDAMPPDYGQLLSEAEINDLIAFLLEQ